MDKLQLKEALKALSAEERDSLLKEIEKETKKAAPLFGKRREMLDNKIGCCPHCGGKKYHKHGIDKGCQRYYCNTCKRTFTEYTGTWVTGIHKKSLLGDYLKLMEQELSLDKIKARMGINKKTAFDWRHKILSGMEKTDGGAFNGITECDETFFLRSSKGAKLYDRPPRKRGGTASKKGVIGEHVAVIVAAGRNKELGLSVARFGRIRKTDIDNAIGQRISKQTILCTDSHLSYRGFAIDNELEHHTVRVDKKQYVKQKIYHVQHVNSIDSRLKGWIEYHFYGVSTKYLQKYLNWFKAKERLKKSALFLEEFADKSMEDISARDRYMMIAADYEALLKTATHN